MTSAYLNQIETAVPVNDIHEKFVSYAPSLLRNERNHALFKRMAERSGIEHRYSIFKPHADPLRLDEEGFYQLGQPSGTQKRMQFYERQAFSLAKKALDRLDFTREEITHVIVTSCTGFYAPGLDMELATHYGLSFSVERSFIGFMGCHAAINALKLARHIVRSSPVAKVLILNLEICTLHLQQTDRLEDLLSFLLFADGCAASIVSAEPRGIEIQNFYTDQLPDSAQYITWKIGDAGFNMNLSGQVPALISTHIADCLSRILKDMPSAQVQNWAVHPGGRSILDAVSAGAGLTKEDLSFSRKVLKNYGNMSSPTIMFVLNEIMHHSKKSGAGVAMAFGPGLSIEAMRFAT